MCSTYVALFLFALNLAPSERLTVVAKHVHQHQIHHQQQNEVGASRQKHKPAVSEDKMYNYLMQFDYLPSSDLESGALRTEEQLKDAIRNLQSFGGIPVTGEIDQATAKLIETPRCGVGDNKHSNNFSPNNLDYDVGHSSRKRRYVLQGPKWDKLDLTWSLVNQSMSEAGNVRSLVGRALGVWEKNSKLTFREVYSDQADIQVLFARRDHGDGYKFDGPGQVLAHAFYPGVGRGGDAHFDAEETWEFEAKTDDNRGTNFLNVALHELGHSLGLGHSSDTNAVMFPYYQNNEVDGTLPDDDRTAIQELYGAKVKTWGPYRPATTTTKRTTTHRTLTYYPNPPRRYPYNRPPSTTYATPTTYRTTTHRVTKRPTYKYKPRKEIPDICSTSYDAISVIRNELFVFHGQFHWRYGHQGLYRGFPTETHRFWKALPHHFNKIDAVYENPEGKIVFFIGRQYYIFDSVSLLPGYPQPLTTLGLPASLTHIDAVFMWGYNNRTYLTSGTLYWRLDYASQMVELDYPRDMSIWAGVGYNIDAAFRYKNGKTYFFKNQGYWEFNDNLMKVAHPRPKKTARDWMKCPRGVNDVDEEQRRTAPLVAGDEATEPSSMASKQQQQPWTMLLLAMLMAVSYGVCCCS